MDLFKVSPESSKAFVFLKHYATDNKEYYDMLAKHALRVLGIVSLLVKEVMYWFEKFYYFLEFLG